MSNQIKKYNSEEHIIQFGKVARRSEHVIHLRRFGLKREVHDERTFLRKLYVEPYDPIPNAYRGHFERFPFSRSNFELRDEHFLHIIKMKGNVSRRAAGAHISRYPAVEIVFRRKRGYLELEVA